MPPIASTTFRIPPDLLEWLDQTRDYPDDGGEDARGATRTARLIQVLERYREIMRLDLPQLTEPEWNLVRDALNGTWLNDGTERFAWAEVADGIKINRLDQKWQVDGALLVDKLRNLSHGQLVALVEDVRRWWMEQR